MQSSNKHLSTKLCSNWLQYIVIQQAVHRQGFNFQRIIRKQLICKNSVREEISFIIISQINSQLKRKTPQQLQGGNYIWLIRWQFMWLTACLMLVKWRTGGLNYNCFHQAEARKHKKQKKQLCSWCKCINMSCLTRIHNPSHCVKCWVFTRQGEQGYYL